MKSVLISIRPQWVVKIANSEKTIEIRKTKPKLEPPFKCFIYCTVAKEDKYILERHENGFATRLDGKVIGEFICDWIKKITPHYDIENFVNQYIHEYPAILGENDCLSFNEMKDYLGNNIGYDWHISDLKIYDKPKGLSEFYTPLRAYRNASGKRVVGGLHRLIRPPQSWCYVAGQE